MSWVIPGREHRVPPREYVQHINKIGGMNRFGDPNFKIVWGQSEMMKVWGTDANGKKGQHIISKCGDVPAWFILVWKPPECYGTPELWYALTWDWETDAPTIGEFPWRGEYELAPFNLFSRRVEANYMHIDALELSHWLLDLLIPNLMKEIDVTYTQRKTAIQNRILAERTKANKLAMDAYMDAGPAFHGAAGTHESNRERWAQRVKEKQANMRISRDQIVQKMGLGHMQRKKILK